MILSPLSIISCHWQANPGKFINELAEVLEIHTSDVGQPVQVLQRVDSATRTGFGRRDDRRQFCDSDELLE
ncbi:hypothetical protein ACLBOM_38245 [Escherichia coli]